MFSYMSNIFIKYILALALFMIANTAVAYGKQASNIQSNGNQINELYEILLYPHPENLIIIKALRTTCPELQSKCLKIASKDMLTTYYSIEDSISFNVSRINISTMEVNSSYDHVLSGVKEGTLSWLALANEYATNSETMSVKVRRISTLDNNSFWIEFETESASYMEVYDEKTDYISDYDWVNTTWYASIVTFNDLNELQYRVKNIPIMQQESYRNYGDNRDDVYMEKHQINVSYSKGKLNIKKRTKRITQKQEKWLGRRTLK